MGYENNPAPEYNKKSVGGVQMSGLMKVRTNSANASAQIHGAGPTSKSYSGPGSADNASFDKKRQQKEVEPSMKGLPLTGALIASEPGMKSFKMPANRSNYKSVGDCN
jgi:hypothetical protein